MIQCSGILKLIYPCFNGPASAVIKIILSIYRLNNHSRRFTENFSKFGALISRNAGKSHTVTTKTNAMLRALDKDDLRILYLLQHDARLTHKEIANKIGKTVSPVYERIKKLQADGFIKHYAAILDNKLINKSLIAYTNVHLKEHSNVGMLEFEKRVGNFPEVMECYHMTGEYDFLLRIAVSNMDAYYEFVINRLSKLSNVGTVQSYFVLHESKKKTAYPLPFEIEASEAVSA